MYTIVGRGKSIVYSLLNIMQGFMTHNLIDYDS